MLRSQTALMGSPGTMVAAGAMGRRSGPPVAAPESRPLQGDNRDQEAPWPPAQRRSPPPPPGSGVGPGAGRTRLGPHGMVAHPRLMAAITPMASTRPSEPWGSLRHSPRSGTRRPRPNLPPPQSRRESSVFNPSPASATLTLRVRSAHVFIPLLAAPRAGRGHLLPGSASRARKRGPFLRAPGDLRRSLGG